MAYDIKRVLGQDDWLFYARTTDGELVYYNSETDYYWDDTPYHGGPNAMLFPSDGHAYMAAWREYNESSHKRIDSSWMHMSVVRRAKQLYWQPCDYDTDGTYMGWPEDEDDEFVAKSRAHYLCD